jgi:hypothetical protein
MSCGRFGVGSVDVSGDDGSGLAPAKTALVARVVRMSLYASASMIVWTLDIYATRRFMVSSSGIAAGARTSYPAAVEGHAQDAEIA